MKVHIQVIAEDGSLFEGDAELAPSAKKQSSKNRIVQKRKSAQSLANINFALNVRAFMNKYAKQHGGAAKFTLLVAHSVRGEEGKAVAAETIVSSWNKMRGVLGPFYRIHATRAKEQGWIDSPERGSYELAASWLECLKDE